MRYILTVIFLIAIVVAFSYRNIYCPRGGERLSECGAVTIYAVSKGGVETVPQISKTDAEWKKLLTREQYKITVGMGTEKPFVNKYYANKKKGIYKCARCGTDLFSSDQKYDSGSGWPSFTAPVSRNNIILRKHLTLLGMRTRVFCARCSAYLGEVFDDGPPPARERYCMDSAAFDFIEAH